MRKILLFIFLFLNINSAFAQVNINENDAKLFQKNGYTLEDIQNAVDYYRNNGLSDNDIQKKLDKKISELKMNNNISGKSDFYIDKSQYEINLEKLKYNQYLNIVDKRNENSPVYAITKDELKICEQNGASKDFLNDIYIVGQKAQGISDEMIYKNILEFIAEYRINEFKISDIDLLICKIMWGSEKKYQKILKDFLIKGYSDAEIRKQLHSYLFQIKSELAIICFFIFSLLSFLIFIMYQISKKIIKERKEIMSKIPKENYHILGYITFLYLGFISSTKLIFDVDFDYGCYQVLRWLVFLFSLWTTIRMYKENSKSHWLLVFAAVVILFNPILMLKFEEEVWQILDFITLSIFLIYAYLKRKI